MDHYFVLGLQNSATTKDIEKAYKNLAKKYHPDKGGDEDKFKEIVAAYEVLRDHDTRDEYDKKTKSNFFSLINLNFVPYQPKIINIEITLKELINSCEKEICINMPQFFNKSDEKIAEDTIIISCPFCYSGSCSTCDGTKKLIKSNVFCREVAENIKIQIERTMGIYDGYKKDMRSYILFFNILTPPCIKLQKFDIYLNVAEPINKYIKKETIKVNVLEPRSVELSLDNINCSVRVVGGGLYKNKIIRGDLLVLLSTFIPLRNIQV
jgi:DnaJ-class molecular chaperone